MKKTIIAFILLAFIMACKNEKPEKANAATSQEKTEAKTTRNGNTITQKVTVAPDNNNSNIDAATAMSMIKKDQNIKVLDVRTPKEIEDGSYPNSLKIDYNGNDFKSQINKLDKNNTYIVYCRSGGRSKKAVSMMKAFGFSNVYNMKDGFDALNKASK